MFIANPHISMSFHCNITYLVSNKICFHVVVRVTISVKGLFVVSRSRYTGTVLPIDMLCRARSIFIDTVDAQHEHWVLHIAMVNVSTLKENRRPIRSDSTHSILVVRVWRHLYHLVFISQGKRREVNHLFGLNNVIFGVVEVLVHFSRKVANSDQLPNSTLNIQVFRCFQFITITIFFFSISF